VIEVTTGASASSTARAENQVIMIPPGQDGENKVSLPSLRDEKKGRRKLSGTLLALSAAAIASVYTVGYVSTESSLDKLTNDAGVASASANLDSPSAVSPSATAAPSATSRPATSVPSLGSAGRTPGQVTAPPASSAGANAPTTPPATATPSPAPSATASPTQTAVSGYRDGTYTGTGSSRHGGMQVTVVIKNGKIVSAAVSQCGTRYPCSDVDSLVRSVVNQQAAPVNHVSGATDSSRAYTTAVKAALSQAKA
jgi:uncharacterized protein with FMN-binding domain